jgi:hypothetical protein
MSLGFYAIQQMVLADASVLLFTSPIWTFFLVSPSLSSWVVRQLLTSSNLSL